MRRDDRGRHRYLQNGARRKENLRADAGTKMGDCDGRMRFYRRHVSLLRGLARNRSASTGGRLHFWLPATAGSLTGRADEIAGEDFDRTRVQKPEAGTGRKARGRVRMSDVVIPSEVRDLTQARCVPASQWARFASIVRFFAPLRMTALCMFV